MTSYTKNIVIDYAVPTNGTSDCSVKWADFYTFLQSRAAGDIVTLTVPNAASGGANTYVFNAPGSSPYLFNGVLGGLTVIVNATGVTFSDGGGNGYFLAGPGILDNDQNSSHIASAQVGDTTVQILTLSQISRYTVGQYICIGGIDMQGYGSPPNTAFHEYRKITAINTSTGVISFTPALTNQYLSTWPLYNAGGDFTPDQGGPATIWAMPVTWDLDLTVNGLTISQPTIQTYCKCRTATFSGGGALGAGLVPTANDTMNWTNFNQLTATIEVDKVISNLNISGGTINQLFMQSMCGPTNLTMTNVTLTTLNGTPRYLTVTGGSINSLQVGTLSYGHTDRISVTGCSIASISVNPNREDDILSKYTIASGVISSQDSLNGPLRWAVPGSYITFRGAYNFEGGFKVLAVTQDSGYTRVHTTLTGGWPTIPLSGDGKLSLVCHPCPDFTMRTTTGCADVVDLSGAPANRPLWSYSQRTYTKATAVVTIPVWGLMTSITMTPTATYAGAQSPAFGMQNPFVINGSGVAVHYDPNINPKVGGSRVLTPTSHTGTQSGDSLTDPGAGTVLLNDQTVPKFSTSMTDGDATVTLEIITNHGVGLPWTCTFV